MFLTGVMDGHDGALAAEIVSEKLPGLVLNKCLKGEQSLPHEAHVDAFQTVENIMKKQDSTAGCCVNSIVVWGRYLWCSNLGDCRAVYVPLEPKGMSGGSNNNLGKVLKTGKFQWLSRDQRASK